MTHACTDEMNLDQLAGIRSFVVAADEHLKITWASESVLRRVANALGLKVPDIVEAIDHREEISPSAIARKLGVQHQFFLKSGDCSTPLIGQWISSCGGFILLASPDVRKPEDLNQFSFADFLESDPSIELLMTRYEHIESLKEAKSTAKALQEKERRYRSILETAIDGFWISDRKGRIIEVNDSYCKAVGYSREELLTMSIPDVEAAEDAEETAMHIGLILKHGYDRFRTRHRRKDGELIDVDVSVTLFEEGGGQFIVFLRDITDRRRAEEALRESEDKLHSYVEYSPIGIFIVDEEGHYRDCNRAAHELLGCTREELLKLSIPDITPEKHTGIGVQSFLTLKEKGHVCSEVGLLRKDRTTVPVILEAVRLPDNTFIAYCTDITERKQMEVALQESEVRLNDAQFIGKVGSWEWDMITQKQEWSDNYFAIHGLQRDEVRPSFEFFRSMIHPEDIHILNERVRFVEQRTY
jgi:PAS domain S-box-containing protein